MKLRGLQDSFQLFMKSPSFQILLTYGGMEAVTKTREMKAKQWILAPISPFPHRSTHHQSHTYTYTHNLHTQTHTTHSNSTLTSMHSHAHTNNKQTLRDDRESQTEKDNYHMTSLICGVQKIHKNSLTKQKQTHRYSKQTYGYHLGEWCGR